MADFRAMAGRKLLNAVEIKCLKEQLETGSKGWVMGQVLKSSLSRTVLGTKNRVFNFQLKR